MYMSVWPPHIYICMYIMYVYACLVPAESPRSHHVPRNQDYRWWWATMWVPLQKQPVPLTTELCPGQTFITWQQVCSESLSQGMSFFGREWSWCLLGWVLIMPGLSVEMASLSKQGLVPFLTSVSGGPSRLLSTPDAKLGRHLHWWRSRDSLNESCHHH